MTASKRYQPQKFEEKWSKYWLENKTYRAKLSENSDKKYVLDMFPYPSGAGLHVGHPRGYTATDILSRFYRMKGFDVLHPMGWDAFGLPAENAAIKAKTNPKNIVPENIKNFKRQMQSLGFSYDWDLEFATTDPEYFKWTQWLFIQFFKMGLLYKKNTPINYCPFCKTGLAEEEVLPDGTHERCGNAITKKDLPQWIFRITKYADVLLESLKDLKWPKGILEMQKNWIGKKEGINIKYPIIDTSESITCFTTRPDTNFGATFIVIAPEHELVSKIIDGSLSNNTVSAENIGDLKEYVEKTNAKTELERQAEGRKKTGVFTGFYALNRLNNKKIPVWVSDFVLKDFGTGAVVGVPGHDIRDFEFAKEFNIEIIRVISGKDGDKSEITKASQVQEAEGKIINSGFLNGMDVREATTKIMDFIEEKGWGTREVSYHLRDWIFSRQRYWGEPIPMVYCTSCAEKGLSGLDSNQGVSPIRFKDKSIQGKSEEWISEIKDSMVGWFPIDDKRLPLNLPDVESYEPLESAESPLAAVSSFVKTTCPNCGEDATCETDTMPNWAGSCWYFIYFAQKLSKGFESQINKSPSFSNWQEMTQGTPSKWLPVDWYLGGAEHAVLHLLYSRFWMHAMYDINLVETEEPFLRLRNVGMILAEDNRKMSKSWGNVINPDDVIAEFGADALRIYEMFMAPFSQEIAWSMRTLQGSYRFLKRIWNLCYLYVEKQDLFDRETPENIREKLDKTINKVEKDIPLIKFNTAIASMMEFLNEWEKSSNKDKRESLSKKDLKRFIKILAPFAPYMAEEVWRNIIGERGSIHLSVWPEIDNNSLKNTVVNIPIQVNGKVRAVIKSSIDISEKKLLEQSLKDDNIKKYTDGNNIKKIVYVKNKILNLIVK